MVLQVTTAQVKDLYRGALIPTGENVFELIDEEQADAEFEDWLSRVQASAAENERLAIIEVITKRKAELLSCRKNDLCYAMAEGVSLALSDIEDRWSE